MSTVARVFSVLLLLGCAVRPAAAQVFKPTSLSYGNQVLGKSASQAVTFTNTQAVPLTIASIVANGDFAVSSTNCPISTSPLSAGVSCSISVAFTPTALGTRTGALTVTDNAGTGSQSANLSGNGVAPAAFSTASLWMGNQAIGTTSPAKTLTLTNNQAVPLTITGIAVSGDFAQTSNCPVAPASLAARSSCTVSVTFTPTATGTRTGTLTATDDASNSPQSVSLSGTGLVPVALSNTALSFGSQVVNTTTAAQNVTLKNNLSTPLSITSIGTSGDFEAASNCPIAPSTLGGGGASCTISVTFTPTLLGSRTGMLSIVDNAGTSPQAASLSGTGTLTGLSSIAVTPANTTIVAGSQQQFTATGTFTNGTSQDVSRYVAWTSSNKAIATIAPGGVASALAAGITTLKAYYGVVAGSTGLTVASATRTLQSIAVTPAGPAIAAGQTQQFTATGTYSDGSTQNLTNTVAWISSATSVACIGGSGLATGLMVGTTTIMASSGNISGSTLLNVNPAVLVSLAVTPANSSIALGTTQQMTATGTYSDGSTLDLTMLVTWASSVSAITTISNASPTSGLATSVAVGQTTISATMGSLTGSTTLTVKPAALVSIAVTPAIPSIALGVTQQFTATGTFTDGTTQNITTTAQWSSSNSNVAAISNSSASQGLATSVAIGATTVVASSGNVSGSTTLTVTAAVLVSIAVTPANPSVALGTTQQFTAIGTFSDNTAQDLTSTASWSSSDSTIAALNTSGLATTTNTGTAVITAATGNLTGTTQLIVTPAAIVSITVTPSSIAIANGTAQQFSATALFSDGTTQDVTATAYWTSSSATVATISNTPGTNGLTTTIGPGTTTITASSGSISGTAALTVNPAPLVSIAVTPQSPSIPLGTTVQLTATGAYADGSSQDITATVTWSTSDATVATINNTGLANSSGIGTANITASSGSVTGTTTITVSSASLSSIAVTPANTSLYVSGTQQYTATGTYTDGTIQDLTSTVTWNSSSPSVATISSAGFATGVAAGNATISASFGTVSGSTTLTVVPPGPVLVSIAILPANGSTPLGTTQQFTAIGTYSDGSTVDLTASAVWSSSATNVLVISNAAGRNGFANTIAVGQTTVAATLGNITGFTGFTVGAPAAVSLSVLPQSLSVATGSTNQLTATATYTDGSTANLTSTVTWASSAGTATVNASGVVTSIAPGSAVLTATLGGLSASSTLNISRMSWQPYTNPVWDGPVSAIVNASNGDVLLGANGTGVYKSSDGHTWTLMGSPAEPGIQSLLWSGTALYAGTHDGAFVSSDEGATWTRFGGGLRTGTCVFALLNANGAFFAATDQGLYRMGSGSASWSRVVSGNEFRALYAASSGRLLAGSTSAGNGGGPGGDIFTSTDGITWTKVGITNAWSVRAFAQDAAGTLYAGAFHKTFTPGGLYTSTDGGVTWSGPTLGAYSVQAITVTGAAVYLGTTEGVLFVGPQSWQPVTNPSGKSILALAYPFLASDGIYRLDDGTHPALGSTPEVMQVLQDTAGHTYWRSSYFGIWSSTEGYIGPTGIGAAGQMDDLMFLNASGELVALDEDTVYHRVNGQWVKSAFPNTPIRGRFYTSVVLGDGTILISDVNDRIWKSTDGGSSFAYVATTSGTAGVLFNLYYSNGSLYGASEGKNIVVSPDGGNTWNALPQFLPGTPNVNTYAVTITAAGTLLGGRAGGTSYGCLFRYIAGAWQRSDQGIPVGQSVYRLYSTQGAVYALADNAVYQSVDDGQTWTALSGPKFFPAYTAEFRPITVTSTADGHLMLGVLWEGRGAYVSEP